MTPSPNQQPRTVPCTEPRGECDVEPRGECDVEPRGECDVEPRGERAIALLLLGFVSVLGGLAALIVALVTAVGAT
jgi:hypothetical protein